MLSSDKPARRATPRGRVGVVSGHAPGHLVARLQDWLAVVGWVSEACEGNEDDVRATDIVWLMGKLWNCTDQLGAGWFVADAIVGDADVCTIGRLVRVLRPEVAKLIAAGELPSGTVRRW